MDPERDIQVSTSSRTGGGNDAQNTEDDSLDDYHEYLKTSHTLSRNEPTTDALDGYHDYLIERKYSEDLDRKAASKSLKRTRSEPSCKIEFRTFDQSCQAETEPTTALNRDENDELHGYHDYLKTTKDLSHHFDYLHDEFVAWRSRFVERLQTEAKITQATACHLVQTWTQEPFEQGYLQQPSGDKEKGGVRTDVYSRSAESPSAAAPVENEKQAGYDTTPEPNLELTEKTSPGYSLTRACADAITTAELSSNDAQGVFAIGAACVAAVAAISVASVKLLAVDIPKKNLEIEQAKIAALEIRTNVRKLEHEMKKEENGIREAQKDLAADKKALENDRKDLQERIKVLEYQQKALDRDRQPWKEAEWYQRSAMKRLRDEYGEKHITSLSASECLAMAYCFQGRLEEAEHMQRKVVTTLEETLGDEHPRVFGALDTLSTILRRRGFFDAAADIEFRITRKPSQSSKLQPPIIYTSDDDLQSPKGGRNSPRDSCRSLELPRRKSSDDRSLLTKAASISSRGSQNGHTPSSATSVDSAKLLNDLLSPSTTSKPSLDQLQAYQRSVKDLSALRDAISRELRDLPSQLNDLGAKRWADKINQTVLCEHDNIDGQVAALCEEVKTIFVESSAKWGQWVQYTEKLKSRAASVSSP